MNLFAITRGTIAAVNPEQRVEVRQFTGHTVGEDGSSVPTYRTVRVMAQVQPVPEQTLNHMNNLSQTGVYRNFYLEGDFRSLDRESQGGGDLIIWNGSTWLIQQVGEEWNQTAGWTRVMAAKQV